MTDAAPSRQPVAIYGALAANLGIAAVKLVAAYFTGSSVMLAESFHSLIDTGNEALLLLGWQRSRLPPDADHPFGYARDLYISTFVVAILLFGVGGGLSIYEGIKRLSHPAVIAHPLWSYVTIGLALVCEGSSWLIARRELGRRVEAGERRRLAVGRRRRGQGPWDYLRQSKDPSLTAVLVEDSAALTGLLMALAGTLLSDRLGWHAADGAASIGVGLLLAAAAGLLARQSRDLLIGRKASDEVDEIVRSIAASDPAVRSAREPLTIHMGPEHIVASIDVAFAGALTTADIERAVTRIKERIKERLPSVQRVLISVAAAT